MKWSDLSLVNLHRRQDGGWSYTAYLTHFDVFRTNNCHTTVYDCIDEIEDELRKGPGGSAGRVRKTAGRVKPQRVVRRNSGK